MSDQYYRALWSLIELAEASHNIYSNLKDIKIQRSHSPENAGAFDLGSVGDSLSEQEDRVIPLESALKNQFETAFDADLSSVRLHVGPQASLLTQRMQAEALTVGSDIFFGEGKYNPQTQDGLALLAHELQHVIQFRQGGPMVFLEDAARLEQEAGMTEAIMSSARLHNMRAPHLADGGGDDEDVFDDSLADVPNGNESIDEFSSADRSPRYRVTFPSGKAYTLSEEEKERVTDLAVRKLNNHLHELKMILPEDEYERKVLSYMNLLKRGVF